MKFNLLAPVVLVVSFSMPPAANANAIVIEGAKRVASSVAAKVVISAVVRAANSRAVHDFGMRRSAHARARMQQNFSAGGGGGSRVLEVRVPKAIK